jgi:hypothetical protein|tara:strand:+ start:178 stop:432 length:255 start_codon:yes stop_codon:yes gene_type:complete
MSNPLSEVAEGILDACPTQLNPDEMSTLIAYMVWSYQMQGDWDDMLPKIVRCINLDDGHAQVVRVAHKDANKFLNKCVRNARRS